MYGAFALKAGNLFSVTFLLMVATATQAAPKTEAELVAQERPIVIDKIAIVGLGRTSQKVVHREIRIKPGQAVDRAQVLEAVQRLRNLQIFNSVEGSIVPGENRDTTLRLEVEERWTTLPFARATGGGGTMSFILGLYDINVLGDYFELGAQYENLTGAHSAVLWFREPRVFSRYLRVGGDGWLTTRNRDIFAFEGDLQGGFTLRRNRLHVFTDVELHRYFAVGSRVDANWDNVTEANLGPDRLELNQLNNLDVYQRTRQVFLGTYLRMGRLDFDRFLVGGQEARLEIDRAQQLWGAQNAFWRINMTNLMFWRLRHNANLGLQLRLGYTGTNLLHFQNFLGGFESVRGFGDGQFRGRAFWHGNLEYRIPSLQTSWIVLQHAAFADVGRVGATARDVLGTTAGNTAASAGGGIRIISPKVFRLSIRFDLAYALYPQSGLGISFGTQQFF